MFITQFEGWLHFSAIILLIFTNIGFLIKLFTIENIIKKAGKNYLMVTEKTSTKEKAFIFTMIIISIFLLLFSIIILIIFSFDLIIVSLIILSILMIIFFIIILSLNKKKDNIKFGIYENGIINNIFEFIEWKDIHSYIVIDNDLFGYYKDGNTFDYRNILNIEEIKYLFIKNRVKERDNK
jgi:hypothetical protein